MRQVGILWHHAAMTIGKILAFTFVLLGLVVSSVAQTPKNDASLATNAPADKPVAVTSAEAQKFLDLIQPYVEKARKTYPEAKTRFFNGLPKGEAFFVTARLTDKEGHWEEVFLRVREIKDGKIRGTIASDIDLVKGYKMGDEYTLPESELLDWTISKPDGTEEGNFVGKFLDSYKPD
jgi:hypothetical protein